MNKAWRPDGWVNPYITKVKIWGTNETKDMVLDLEGQDRIFEAGADAMLEALKKDVSAGHTEGRTKEYTVINSKGVAGTFVFIPDKES